MLININTPFDILEELTILFLEQELELETLLEAVEIQHERVSTWLERLLSAALPEFAEGREMHELGCTANRGMLDSLERLHKGLEESELDDIETAVENLESSHHLLLSSFTICNRLQESSCGLDVVLC